MRLKQDGSLEIRYKRERDSVIEGHLVRAMRSLGYLGSLRVASFPGPGNSIHYAGTLPMRERPYRKYETDRSGLLFASKRVHVADAATFPVLPSKNLTFTIMANAMRVAQAVQEELSAA